MNVDHIELRPSRTKKGIEWAWHAKASNGRKLGWTGEKHTSRPHCLQALLAVTDCERRKIPVFEYDLKGNRLCQLWAC